MPPLTTRQHGDPVLYDPTSASSVRLHRLDLGSSRFPEADLQTLLAREPSLLPVDEFEAAFAPLVLLGQEVRCDSGFMDLLFCSPGGYLTLVEVKLWRNPQARREVVGQILDYAKDLAGWSYEDLDAAVRDVNGGAGIVDLLRRVQPDVREDVLVDQVERNLRLGRVLLVVVGDGIREGVERIAEHLQRQNSLQFSLVLLELALYQMETGQLLVLPRTLARTVEMSRIVFEVGEGTPRIVNAPSSAAGMTVRPPAPGRRSLTETVFFEAVEFAAGPDVARGVRSAMDDLEHLGVLPTWGLASSVTMRFPDPSSGKPHTVVAFTASGKFWVSYLESPEREGYDPEIPRRYLDRVVEITGASRMPTALGTSEAPVGPLLAHRDAFISAAAEYVEDIRAAADA